MYIKEDVEMDDIVELKDWTMTTFVKIRGGLLKLEHDMSCPRWLYYLSCAVKFNKCTCNSDVLGVSVVFLGVNIFILPK